MKTAYWILNGIALVLTATALLSLVYPSLNDLMVQSAGRAVMFGPLFAYLALSVGSTLFSIIAIFLMNEGAYFPYYCMAMTWAPLFFLAILGAIMAAAGQLYWMP